MAAHPRFLLLPAIVTIEPVGGAPNGWRLARGPRLTGPTAVGWRLLGANNRELGRSVCVYPVQTARRQILALQAGAERLSTTLASGPGGSWRWRASLDGVTVALSGRSYHRQRECLYNLHQFLGALPTASICDHVVATGEVPAVASAYPVGEQLRREASALGARSRPRQMVVLDQPDTADCDHAFTRSTSGVDLTECGR